MEEPDDFPECLQLRHVGPTTYMTITPRLTLSPIPAASTSPPSPLDLTSNDTAYESDENKENEAPNQ